MKVVAVLGSPRKKGTSARIAGAFLEEAEKKGAEISTYHLNRMDFRGCQGCYACKGKQEHCALKDDLTPLLADMEAADVTVFASPVYFYDVSGQFKTFFDRTYSLLKPDFMTNPAPCRLSPGKKALLVIAQGAGADTHKELAEKYHLFLTWYGYDATVIHASGLEEHVQAAIEAYGFHLLLFALEEYNSNGELSSLGKRIVDRQLPDFDPSDFPAILEKLRKRYSQDVASSREKDHVRGASIIDDYSQVRQDSNKQ